MMTEIILKLTSIQDTSSVTKIKVSAWVSIVETHRCQTTILDSYKETKVSDTCRSLNTGPKIKQHTPEKNKLQTTTQAKM